MEYPTLFTAGTDRFMPAGVHMPEMVTIHEFGHGYWYGMVGSNEFEEAWLDEGINTYSEVKAMAEYYGPDRSLIDLGPVRISDLSYQRVSVIGAGRFDPILRRSWDFVSGGSYSLNVYNKACLMLLTLERYLGEETMARIMKTYFETWKFRHPTSEDFIRTAETVSGRDLQMVLRPGPPQPRQARLRRQLGLLRAGRAKPRGSSRASWSSPIRRRRPRRPPPTAAKSCVVRQGRMDLSPGRPGRLRQRPQGPRDLGRPGALETLRLYRPRPSGLRPGRSGRRLAPGRRTGPTTPCGSSRGPAGRARPPGRSPPCSSTS